MGSYKFISVAMTVFNGEEYLEDQITSILEQTLKPTEIVICNDASEDKSIEILDKFSKKYKEIKVINNKKNQGVVASFEIALKNLNSKTDYIFLSDHDDIWLENKIEKMIKNSSGCSSTISDLKVVNSDLKIINNSFFKYSGFNNKKELNFINILIKNPAPGCSIMFKGDLLRDILPFPKNIVMHDWWITLVSNANNGIKILHDPLVLYRQHSGNQLGVANNNLLGLKKRINKFGSSLKYLKYREERRKIMIENTIKHELTSSNDLSILFQFYLINGSARNFQLINFFLIIYKSCGLRTAFKESLFYLLNIYNNEK